MNKALLISIQPQHAVNILNGKKTLELRSWIPKNYKGWVYVYVTKGKKDILYKYKDKYYTQHYLTFTDSVEVLNSKAVFRFWFDDYDDVVYTIKNEYAGCNGSTLSDWSIGSFYLDKLQLTYKDILDYGKGKDLYAWHIKQIEVFDTPKELSEFQVRKLKKEVLHWYGDVEYFYEPLKKAPQKMQWVYVEE